MKYFLALPCLARLAIVFAIIPAIAALVLSHVTHWPFLPCWGACAVAVPGALELLDGALSFWVLASAAVILLIAWRAR